MIDYDYDYYLQNPSMQEVHDAWCSVLNRLSVISRRNYHDKRKGKRLYDTLAHSGNKYSKVRPSRGMSWGHGRCQAELYWSSRRKGKYVT